MRKEIFRWREAVLHEDEDYVMVNKPAGISTLEDRNSSVNMLDLARQSIPDAQVCHRLDKDTSGVLVFAKNPDAYRNMAIQLEDWQVEKMYHALCEGRPEWDQHMIEDSLHDNGKGKIRVDQRRGKPSATVFTTLENFKLHSLMECRPVTGRTHQIRVHLAAHGCPIAGDEKYGGHPLLLSKIKPKYHLKQDTEEQPLIKRTALHAKFIRFMDLNGEMISAEAEYPETLR